MVVDLIVLELIVLILHNLMRKYNVRSRSLKVLEGHVDVMVFMFISLCPVFLCKGGLSLCPV